MQVKNTRIEVGLILPMCIPLVPGGNSFPINPIGSARATDWEGGGSLPPP